LRIKRSAVFLILIILLIFSKALDCDETFKTKYEFTGFPQVAYTEETGIIGGGITFFRFYNPDKFPDIPKNSITFSARYSQKKQFYALLEPNVYFQDGKQQLTLSLNYKNWPSTFYGIGNHSSENDAEDYTAEEIDLTIKWRKKIWQNWSSALLYEYDYFLTKKTEETGLLNSKDIHGSSGKNIVSGFGFGFICDSRDNENFPSQGNLNNLEIFYFHHKLGSEFDFVRTLIDLRHYHRLAPKHILAFQGVFSYLFADPPFYKLIKLDDYLRAMTTDLFIDKGISAVRMEYRFFPFSAKFLNRFGFVLFLESGQVAKELQAYAINEFKISYGLGFRFSLFTDDIFNLRFDIGFGEGLTNFQASGGESF